eukprot:1295743-Ditylum_brightwellii.AAC.2
MRETKEQILDLTQKDALYDRDEGNSDIECNGKKIQNSRVIGEDNASFVLDISDTKSTAEQWTKL